MTAKLPARSRGVLEQRVGDEYVVISPVDNQAFALSGDLARVWAASGEPGHDLQLPDDVVASAVDELADAGLLIAPAGTSRRTVLRAGGVLAVGALVSVALPTADAAASNGTIPPNALVFNCKDAGSTSPGRATKQTLTVGPSTTARVVTFSLISAGGGGAGVATSTVLNTPSQQTTLPGNGGNGGFIQGTITLPASTGSDIISIYVGCGETPYTQPFSGGGNTTKVADEYAGSGNGAGGNADGVGTYYQPFFGSPTSAQVGTAGAGGGASAIVFSGDTAAPSLVAGAGGGGGAAGSSAQTVQPNGGNGGGTTAGTAGAGTSGTGGGAGTATAGGAGGSTTNGGLIRTAGSGTGPAVAGGTGGIGGVVGNNGATSSGFNASTYIGSGGGGGGGYTGGGGGGGGAAAAGTSAYDGGGGGGSGRAAATATSTSGVATITVTNSGTVTGAPGGSGYGVGGAVVPANSSTPWGPGSSGQPGQISFSTTGGFTIAAS